MAIVDPLAWVADPPPEAPVAPPVAPPVALPPDVPPPPASVPVPVAVADDSPMGFPLSSTVPAAPAAARPPPPRVASTTARWLIREPHAVATRASTNDSARVRRTALMPPAWRTARRRRRAGRTRT